MVFRAGTFLLPSLTGPPVCFRCLSSCRAPRARGDFLPAVCSGRTAVFCLPACPSCAPWRAAVPCPSCAPRHAAGGAARRSSRPWCSRPWPLEQPPLVQPPLDLSSRASEQPPLVQPPLALGAAAPGAATPRPRDAAPGPHGADPAAACDAVPRPCAAHCRPLLPVPMLPVAALPPPSSSPCCACSHGTEGLGVAGMGVMGGMFPFPSSSFRSHCCSCRWGEGVRVWGSQGSGIGVAGVRPISPRPSEVGGGGE
ncbi:unnamed protein product [Closterium sp. NIES-54]